MKPSTQVTLNRQTKLSKDINLDYRQKLTIEKIPLSLLGSLKALVELQISADEECTRIIQGLRGVTDSDLAFLAESSKERKQRNLTVTLDWRCFDRLYEMSKN